MNNTEKRLTLDEVAGITYLTPETVSFSKNGTFPAATFYKDGNGTYESRIWLHKAFPHEVENEFISVQNKDGEEFGLIRNIDVFSTAEIEILKAELERKYFSPKILSILSLKEKYGLSFWKIKTDIGLLDITVHDTYKSLIKVNPDRAILVDATGNRYEIESVKALDQSSFRHLQLYL